MGSVANLLCLRKGPSGMLSPSGASQGGGGDCGNFIPSVLESYDNLSPPVRGEILINCEILINIMILIYFFLIAIILIQKYNVKIFKFSIVSLICKIFNTEISDKLNKFMERIGNYSDKYLLFLLIINVLLILFCVLLNIYINIELSNNLDKFIQLHNQFKVK